jgi:hypothetical protein
MQNMDKNLAEKEEKKKRGFWGFAVRFLVIIFIAFLLIWGFDEYRKYEDRKKLDRFVEETKRLQKEEYDRAMADTYGGKTPQETLRMYIEAVERGDYELASRYFVLGKQEKWKEELMEIAKANKLNIYLEPLKEGLMSRGNYSADGKIFWIDNPVGIDFTLYPNGIWKILEI